MSLECVKHGHYYVYQFETTKLTPNDPIVKCELIRTYVCARCGHEKQTNSVVLKDEFDE